MPAAIHHDPTCPTLNAHSVTDGLGRELWAVWCDHCDERFKQFMDNNEGFKCGASGMVRREV